MDLVLYVDLQGCTGQIFFASGRADEKIFGAGRGREQNPRGGAGQRSNTTGAGQKDHKPIN